MEGSAKPGGDGPSVGRIGDARLAQDRLERARALEAASHEAALAAQAASDQADAIWFENADDNADTNAQMATLAAAARDAWRSHADAESLVAEAEQALEAVEESADPTELAAEDVAGGGATPPGAETRVEPEAKRAPPPRVDRVIVGGARQEFPPYKIIRTIVGDFFRYRGLVPAARSLAAEPPPEFTLDRVITDMERLKYVRIDARRLVPRGKRDWVVFLVLSDGGKYSRHSPDLRNLLGRITTDSLTKAGRLDELIIVAEQDFFTHKSLLDLVIAGQASAAKARAAAGATTVDPDGAAPFINAYRYRVFSLTVPEEKGVDPHRIMSREDVKKLFSNMHIVRQDMGVIYASDPPAIWIGAREGDFIEIKRRSSAAMTAMYYRRVEKGVFKD